MPRLGATSEETVDVLVAGSLAMDLSCDYSPITAPGQNLGSPTLSTSNPAVISQNVGGVGHNVATALHYCGINTRLCSAVGDDETGRAVLALLQQKGLDTSEVKVLGPGFRTARYVAVNSINKDLVVGMADMSILDSLHHDFTKIWQPSINRCQPQWLIVDGNWDASTLTQWIAAGRARGTQVAYEPVSVEKSSRILQGSSLTVADIATPNEAELLAMAQQVNTFDMDPYSIFDIILPNIPQDATNIVNAALKILPRIPCLITKLGPRGILLTKGLHKADPRLNDPAYSDHVLLRKTTRDISGQLGVYAGIYVRYFAPAEIVPQESIVSVNGVGDTFLGMVVAGLVRDATRPIEELIDIAQRGAILTLKSNESVSPRIKSIAHFSNPHSS